jgi:integrase
MNLNQLNIYFYVRPSGVKNKRGVLYVRVVINSRQIVCSVKGLQMYPSEFDAKTQNPKRNCDLYFEVQNFMVSIRQELNRIHNDFEKKKHILTKEILTASVEQVYHRIKTGQERDAKTFLQVYDEFIAEQNRRVGKTLSKGTVDVRTRYRKVLARSLASWELGMSPICNFTEKECAKVKDSLLEEYAPGTAARIFPVFSMAFDFAVKNRDIPDNPCSNIKGVKFNKATDLLWLEYEEVHRIKELNLTGSAKLYRDAFVFCCFTGLSIGDYELLNPKSQDRIIEKAQSVKDIQPGEIIQMRIGKFLMGKRRKTGTMYRVPILPEAESILNEYGGLENMPYNLVKSSNMLNTIMQMAKIKKTIRFHTARKTMANYLLNVKMMNPFYVKEIMGWIKIEEVTPYTKVNNDTLAVQLLGK